MRTTPVSASAGGRAASATATAWCAASARSSSTARWPRARRQRGRRRNASAAARAAAPGARAPRAARAVDGVAQLVLLERHAKRRGQATFFKHRVVVVARVKVKRSERRDARDCACGCARPSSATTRRARRRELGRVAQPRGFCAAAAGASRGCASVERLAARAWSPPRSASAAAAAARRRTIARVRARRANGAARARARRARVRRARRAAASSVAALGTAVSTCTTCDAGRRSA